MTVFFFLFATACPSGFFGLNCSRECHCQNGGVCDPQDGHCTCTPGWMGRFCQQRKCTFLKKSSDCVPVVSLLMGISGEIEDTTITTGKNEHLKIEAKVLKFE